MLEPVDRCLIEAPLERAAYFVPNHLDDLIHLRGLLARETNPFSPLVEGFDRRDAGRINPRRRGPLVVRSEMRQPQ